MIVTYVERSLLETAPPSAPAPLPPDGSEQIVYSVFDGDQGADPELLRAKSLATIDEAETGRLSSYDRKAHWSWLWFAARPSKRDGMNSRPWMA